MVVVDVGGRRQCISVIVWLSSNMRVVTLNTKYLNSTNQASVVITMRTIFLSPYFIDQDEQIAPDLI